MDISLRDYLAGQALRSFMDWALKEKIPEDFDTAEKVSIRYAKASYTIADAMMQERLK